MWLVDQAPVPNEKRTDLNVDFTALVVLQSHLGNVAYKTPVALVLFQRNRIKKWPDVAVLWC